jgi:TPP-dependent pyruvate/acetoin dehydrogenase alpha subunit
MPVTLGRDRARHLLRSMKKIRLVEEGIAARYHGGQMRCPTHLCTGQEAVAAGVGAVLRGDDLAVSTHRSHGHYLGKGGDLRRMLAEIYGKSTGCSGGRGGSMHLIDESCGFMGSTSIVGGTIPVGTGLALSISLKGDDRVSCVFLGDGAAEEGVFYESVNFAALRNLPVLFLCENNLYSVYTPLASRQPAGRKLSEMVTAIGVPGSTGDGNDPQEVFLKTAEAVQAIRCGGGPRFLEFATYRWREHCGPDFDNHIGYRTEDEYLAWRERDPVACWEGRLLRAGFLTAGELAEMERELEAEIADAFRFAEDSPFPDPATAAEGLYAPAHPAGAGDAATAPSAVTAPAAATAAAAATAPAAVTAATAGSSTPSLEALPSPSSPLSQGARGDEGVVTLLHIGPVSNSLHGEDGVPAPHERRSLAAGGTA